VKVIEKKLIDAKQKEYLRIELSIMKLVKHPNVISLERVFETRHHVYMAMPLYPGGDLFDFMKAYRREGVSEDEGRKLIWNILHALKYLHGIGIVHRDLKPENLLLKKKDSPCDVVITDFGLSKFAAPHEAMQAACGTLTYVAPEVLRMEGYGKQVDVWSTGIIMYLVLRAKLPFHDSTKQRIIARILRQKVQLTDPVWKEKSSEAKDLIGLLLEKEPSKRITTKAALEHPWFEPLREAIALASAKGGAAEEKEAVKDVTIESDIDRMASGASIMMIRQLTRRREKMAIPAFDEDEEE
jgi:serine/threonine protein kinase